MSAGPNVDVVAIRRRNDLAFWRMTYKEEAIEPFGIVNALDIFIECLLGSGGFTAEEDRNPATGAGQKARETSIIRDQI
jgi:hypothetical protein